MSAWRPRLRAACPSRTAGAQRRGCLYLALTRWGRQTWLRVAVHKFISRASGCGLVSRARRVGALGASLRLARYSDCHWSESICIGSARGRSASTLRRYYGTALSSRPFLLGTCALAILFCAPMESIGLERSSTERSIGTFISGCSFATVRVAVALVLPQQRRTACI